MEGTIEKYEISSDDLIQGKEQKFSLGDRMKIYEVDVEMLFGKIITHESFIVILNIKNYNEFIDTIGFIFVKSMALTMKDLVIKFNAQTGYTCSGHIHLIFNQKCNKEKYEKSFEIGEKNNISHHPYSGRIQKITTLISSYCSTRFNYHMSTLVNQKQSIYDGVIIGFMNPHEHIFDAEINIFSEENIHEILTNQILISEEDCLKMIGGIYCKKILVERMTGEHTAIRADHVFKKINISRENLEILLNKCWENGDNILSLDELSIVQEEINSDDVVQNTIELNTEKKISSDDKIEECDDVINIILSILMYVGFIIRLDGNCFSAFTKRLKKPFDLIFIKAMALTTMDLVKKFDAKTGYCHSDEISLYFYKVFTEQKYDELRENIERYNIASLFSDGKIFKIITSISAYCSVKFNYHLATLINEFELVNVIHEEKYNDEFLELINSHEQIFDARIIIFTMDKIYEMLNHCIWRSVHDCCKNAISTYARKYFSCREIDGKNGKEMIVMLSGKGINWDNDIPIFIKHGLYVKLNTELEYEFKQFKISSTPAYLEMLLCDHWLDTDNGILLNELSLVREN
jgi:tRNA(His) 5'-end guanylyltransferase